MSSKEFDITQIECAAVKGFNNKNFPILGWDKVIVEDKYCTFVFEEENKKIPYLASRLQINFKDKVA